MIKTKEEVLEYFRDDMYYSVKWEIEERLEREKNLSWRDISDWIRYFVLDLNLPESKNESEALKQIKKITLYMQSKDPESMMSDYDAEFI